MVRVPRILLRAEFVIDFDAAGFVEAGSHQQRLAEVFAELLRQYPDAKFSIRERRERGLKEPALAPAAAATRKLGVNR